MAFSFNKKNLANTTLSSDLTASATSITVDDASIFPVSDFYVTLMPSSELSGLDNSEIVFVTNVSGNTLTVVRAQRDTTAKAFSTGAVVTNGIYSEDMDMAQSVGKKVFSAVWDSVNSEYKINDPMLKVHPDEGTAIRAVFDTNTTQEAVLSVNEDTTATVTATGTNIEIKDAEPSQLVSVQMKGDTTQTTYSGKNLFNINDEQKANARCVGTVVGESITITSTVNSTGYYCVLIPNSDDLLGKAVTLRIGNVTTNTTGRVYVYNAVKTNLTSVSSSISYETAIPSGTSVTKQFTFPNSYASGKDCFAIGFYASDLAGGTAVGDYTTFSNVQLELGSTATDYEPYVGGVASPNPDYPQEVQTVTGRQAIEVRGSRNLFDKDNPSYIGGYFEIGGTISTSSSNRNRIIYIPCEANTTYSLTKATGYWAGGAWMLGVCHEAPAAGVSVYNAVAIGKSTTYNGYTTDSSSTYLVLRCQNADSTTYAWDTQVGDTGLTVWQTVLAGLQIEKGSQATPYVPYICQSYEVNLGKNVLENIGVTETKAGGITFTVNADKSVTVSGVATGANWFKLSEGLQLDGDYFLSGCPGVGSTTTFSLQTSYSGTVYGDYGSGVQLHAGTTDPVWIVIRQGQDFSTPVTFYPQIEKGTSKSSYAPYFTPIELCKIGTYQDYIYKSGEDWYVHKAIATQKYTGASAESWQKFEYGGVSMWRSTVIPSGMDTTAITTDSFRANNATYWVNDGTSVSSALSEGEFGFNAAASNLNIKWNVITTLSNWESWLTSNPMIVYYPLATATDTQITNSALIAQLDALSSAQVYDGTTEVSITSQNLPSWLSLTYYKKGHGKYTAPLKEGAVVADGDVTGPALVQPNIPYELVFQGGYWWVMNMLSSIDTDNISDDAVTTDKLADSSVTNAKLDIDWKDIPELYYQPNDVVSESDTGVIKNVLNGYITSGSADMQVTIPLAKRLDNITSATITKMVVNGRCQGSYLTGLDGTGGDLATLSTNITVHISKETNSLSILFNKSGGWGGTNNSTVSLAVKEYSITLS